ncbi:hypothetical protein O6H91_03G064700 [Diphasiastrum complanatum]|uniref:Uncharacterized protein n=1 Tax=Diphasiastrum complanatum TaxID=34168 RepID=A0ACC2E7J1_DIPCM|nr:hypothetical protein O6H91_03G064700 [Diphasiastrum complanatum]
MEVQTKHIDIQHLRKTSITKNILAKSLLSLNYNDVLAYIPLGFTFQQSQKGSPYSKIKGKKIAPSNKIKLRAFCARHVPTTSFRIPQHSLSIGKAFKQERCPNFYWTFDINPFYLGTR